MFLPFFVSEARYLPPGFKVYTSLRLALSARPPDEQRPAAGSKQNADGLG